MYIYIVKCAGLDSRLVSRLVFVYIHIVHVRLDLISLGHWGGDVEANLATVFSRGYKTEMGAEGTGRHEKFKLEKHMLHIHKY